LQILTADEKRIAGEDCSLVAILKQIADAVLRMARRVQSLHLDAITNRERLAVARGLVDLRTLLAADDWY